MRKKIINFMLCSFFISNNYLNVSASDLNEESKTFRRMTVASYLKTRFEELGLNHIFGVAGNYSAPFLNTILEDKSSPIKVTGIPNELCAGYAADGYARVQGAKGIGAVAVTYGVGAFSVLNAIAGSFVEQIPIVVINGAPTNKEFSNQRSTGLLYSHMMPNPYSNIEVYRSVTVAAERISNAHQAPFQIDAALSACISRKQPVYLEILEDVWRAECSVFALNPINRGISSITISDTDDAVNASLALISERKNGRGSKPMFWAGAEIQRFGLQDLFELLLSVSNFQYTTSALGKSLISEDNQAFSAVGLPQNASCVIGLGAWLTGKDIGNRNIIGDRDKIIVSQGNAFVGGIFFPNVPLESFMKKFLGKLIGNPTEPNGKFRSETYDELLADEYWKKPNYFPVEEIVDSSNQGHNTLNYDNFFEVLNNKWIKNSLDTTVVVDSSFPLIAAQQGLHIRKRNGFIAQASWLSIGYAVPAAIGIKCAIEDKKLENNRMVVIAGDGAFQETCQAVSSYVHLNHNTVVFVIDNGIYGIEQKLVNPSPFRDQSKENLNQEVYSYNELHPWNYIHLAKVFGMGGSYFAETIMELEHIISIIQENPTKNYIVHVKIPKDSIPSVLLKNIKEPGEDELNHPSWPNKEIY